jgi:hypothetical protein
MDYISARISELESYKPAAAESFYNQSFIDRMNEAQAQIDGRYQEMNAAEIQKQESQDAYNTFKGEMRHYSELSKEAENKFGVATAKNDYEESKRAIESIEQTLDALPSTINANSERVMTQNRFELAYNAEATKWQARMNTQQNITDVNKKVWENARREADALAATGLAEQEAKAQYLATMWNVDVNMFAQYKQRWQDAREEKLKIEEQYRNWQYSRAQEEYMRWSKELASLRAAKALEDARAATYSGWQNYMQFSQEVDQRAKDRLATMQAQARQSSSNRYSGGGGGGGGGGGW